MTEVKVPEVTVPKYPPFTQFAQANCRAAAG